MIARSCAWIHCSTSFIHLCNKKTKEKTPQLNCQGLISQLILIPWINLIVKTINHSTQWLVPTTGLQCLLHTDICDILPVLSCTQTTSLGRWKDTKELYTLCELPFWKELFKECPILKFICGNWPKIFWKESFFHCCDAIWGGVKTKKNKQKTHKAQSVVEKSVTT